MSVTLTAAVLSLFLLFVCYCKAQNGDISNNNESLLAICKNVTSFREQYSDSKITLTTSFWDTKRHKCYWHMLGDVPLNYKQAATHCNQYKPSEFENGQLINIDEATEYVNEMNCTTELWVNTNETLNANNTKNHTNAPIAIEYFSQCPTWNCTANNRTMINCSSSYLPMVVCEYTPIDVPSTTPTENKPTNRTSKINLAPILILALSPLLVLCFAGGCVMGCWKHHHTTEIKQMERSQQLQEAGDSPHRVTVRSSRNG